MTTPVILDEDTYTSAISYIIERDFFPDLSKIRAQQDYWEAQTRGSLADLHKAGKALHDIKHRQEENRKEDQPVNFYNESEVSLEKRVNLTLSLDQFQSLYTSEDNASFADLLEKANKKRREQNKWFFDKESKQLSIADRPHESIQWIENSAGWKYKARNALMYFPEGKSKSWIDDNEGRGEKKMIEYTNTFLQPLSEMTKEDQLPSDIEAAKGNMTPWNILKSTPARYGLVDATPTLSPSHVGSPLMTWGSIEGTPLLISGSETPGPRFSLPSVSRREELGMRLSEKASKAYRKKTSDNRIIKGTPRTGAGLMSPAAQYLYRKSHASPRLQSGFDDALRNCYGKRTPVPLFRAGMTPKKK